MTPVGHLCVLTRIVRGRDEVLRDELDRLPTGAESPLAAVEGTHCARFVIVPYLEDRHGRPLDSHSYLVFTAEFDGGAEDYLGALWEEMAPELYLIWSNCEEYREIWDVERFRRYLLDHRIEPTYTVVASPEASVQEIRASLRLREWLARFAVAAQGLPEAELQRRWREAFPEEGGDRGAEGPRQPERRAGQRAVRLRERFRAGSVRLRARQ